MKTVKFSDQIMEFQEHRHEFHEVELIGEPMSNTEGKISSMANTLATDAGVGGGSSMISQKEAEVDHHVITMPIQGGSLPLPSIKEAAGDDELGKDDKKNFFEKGKGMKKILSPIVVRSITRIKHFVSLSQTQTAPVAPTGEDNDRTNSAATRALEGLKFINNKTSAGDGGWSEIEVQFGKLTFYTEGKLPRHFYAKCIGMMEKELAHFPEKLFDATAKRKNIQGDLYDKSQLKRIWKEISDPKFNSKLRTFFDMARNDADRTVTKKEIEQIVYHSAEAKKDLNIQQKAGEYATLIMQLLDPADTKFTTLEELEKFLLPPDQSQKQGSTDKPQNKDNRIKRWQRKTKYFLQENWKRIWVLVLWICVMAGLFAYKFIQYRRGAAYEVMGNCVCFAKGAAETLKLNMAITLLPVCRNTITWLRNKKFGTILPLDDSLHFHKAIIPWAVAIGVGIHAGCHLACDFPRLLHASSEKYKLMEPFFGPQPSNYLHFVKSWEGVTGIGMVFLMAILFTLGFCWSYREDISKKLPKPFNKLTASFNNVFYAHLLLLIVYGLLIMHGIKLYLTKKWYKKTTWMYLAIPISIYLFERLYRKLRSSILDVEILKEDTYCAEDVLALHMTKPERFTYKSGQYMFLKCEDLSPYEWHPFSITSAPVDKYLSLHIQDSGDWTKSLIQKVGDAVKNMNRARNTSLSPPFLRNVQPVPYVPAVPASCFPDVIIDGPYGAPAQEYNKYEVVLLVGSGIGATPMISILKDIVNNYYKDEMASTETQQQQQQIQKKKKSSFKTKKAYFHWVANKEGLFHCFERVMNKVAEDDHRKVIDLHTHLTGPPAINAMLQSLYYAKHGTDAVTGTRVTRQLGRPDWPTVYNNIAQDFQKQHARVNVGVFYCGNQPKIAQVLRKLALEFSNDKTKGIKFEFHKEIF